jgi:ATP-dependent Clp protease ATP-binding subunit ClpA
VKIGAHSAGTDVSTREKQADVFEVIPLDFDYAEPVPGYETSASDCLNHALSIARNLKHAVLSSDHLMLALTVDQAARRLLEQAGNIDRLQEAAMRRLAAMHSKYSAGDPSQTADLEDIRIAARARAAEREQRVSISDLVNAFPRSDGRLIYGQDPKELLLDKIEKNLVPRVSDAMTRIEGAVREATQGQHVTVEKFMQDLNGRLFGNEHSQRELMEDVRRQVREAAELQAATLRDLDAKVTATLSEVAALKQEAEAAKLAAAEHPPVPVPRKYWSWIVL